jgi:hypothetical protein
MITCFGKTKNVCQQGFSEPNRRSETAVRQLPTIKTKKACRTGL